MFLWTAKKVIQDTDIALLPVYLKYSKHPKILCLCALLYKSLLRSVKEAAQPGLILADIIGGKVVLCRTHGHKSDTGCCDDG